MRIVIVGASSLAVSTAMILLKRRHDVVIVERDKQRIDALADTLDCGFVHGDGSKPAILTETGPKDADALLCLTDHDQDNILAALVGRSLGFKRVVPKIEEPEYEHICVELGLSDTIIPVQAIARTLADTLAGLDILELATFIRGEIRFFPFVAREDDAGPVGQIKLPSDTRVICIYRKDGFIIPEPETNIAKGEEGILITHSRNLPELRERWGEAVPGANS
jgi:trk system potassium uptake protein TrkA